MYVVYVCVYVCMCVCVNVCVYVCMCVMYVCMYACMYECADAAAGGGQFAIHVMAAVVAFGVYYVTWVGVTCHAANHATPHHIAIRRIAFHGCAGVHGFVELW